MGRAIKIGKTSKIHVVRSKGFHADATKLIANIASMSVKNNFCVIRILTPVKIILVWGA